MGKQSLFDLLNDSDQYPFLIEQIAIEATSGLRSAEIGLRAFRSRGLLSRLWEGLSSIGQERLTAVGSDLAAVQKATIGLVQAIMSEEVRTQYCIARVLENLSNVNRDLDALEVRMSRAEVSLYKELHESLKTETKFLHQRIDSVDRKLQRRDMIRHIQNQYLAGRFHRELGVVLSSALYIAHIGRICVSESPETQRAEWKSACDVIPQRLSNGPMPLSRLVLKIVEEVTDSFVEAVTFVFAPTQGPVSKVVHAGVQRRLEWIQTY